MKLQKFGRIIFVGVLAFFPLALFAAIDTYDNPLGCGITSLPQFIKGVLTIIVKVGIPVATLFIIWSGFLFLTAQGNEAKLTKAKHSFVWACIGTAVLLGAWLLATAINATIQSLGGGTNGGGSSTTVDGGCGGSAPPPTTTKLALSRVVIGILDGEKTIRAGLSSDPLSGCSGGSSSTYATNDAMTDNGLNPTDPQLLQKSLAILHKEAVFKDTEQAYLLVHFSGAGGGALLHTTSGGAAEVEFTPITGIEGIIDSSLQGVSSINVMHSHPGAFLKGRVPPSIDDLQTAFRLSSINPKTTYNFNVGDFNGVWTYSVPASSKIAQAMNTIGEKGASLYNLPEVKSHITLDACSPGVSIWQMQEDSLNGKYGSDAQAIAQEIYEAAKVLDPFYQQDLIKLPAATSDAEKKAIMTERFQLEQSLGVSLQYTPM